MRPKTFIGVSLPFHEGRRTATPRRAKHGPCRWRLLTPIAATVLGSLVPSVTWAQSAWASLNLPSYGSQAAPTIEVGIASDDTRGASGSLAGGVSTAGTAFVRLDGRLRATAAGLLTVVADASLLLAGTDEGPRTSTTWGVTASLASFVASVEGSTAPEGRSHRARLEARLPRSMRLVVSGRAGATREAPAPWEGGVSLRWDDVARERDLEVQLTSVASPSGHPTLGAGVAWITAPRRAPETRIGWGWADVDIVALAMGSPTWTVAGSAVRSSTTVDWAWTVRPWATTSPRAEAHLDVESRPRHGGPSASIAFAATWMGDDLRATTSVTLRSTP